MNKRREINSRLDKISETSSPSPKRSDKKEDNNKNRLIPFAYPTISQVHKKPQLSMNERNEELTKIRQEVMDRRHRLNIWEQAFNLRITRYNQPTQLVRVLAKGAIKLSEHPDIKSSFLRATKKGRKGILVWLLNWLRQLFGVIRTVLTQRSIYSH